MLRLVERYISKNIPDSAIQIVNAKTNLIPLDYYGNPAKGNALVNWHALQQRQNVEPHKFGLLENKEKIGVNIRQSFSPNVDPYVHTISNQRGIVRKVLVYQTGTNHMQSTPQIRRKHWTIQMEGIGCYRHPTSLFRQSIDPYFKWMNKQDYVTGSPANAITIAKTMGYEVDLIYKHHRYHTQKAYADNFLYEKQSESDVEEE